MTQSVARCKTILKKDFSLKSARFAAIDFETANYDPESACALAIVRVECGKIQSKRSFLIRPPSKHFVFTWIHGIEWEDVKGKPDFSCLWPQIGPLLSGVDFISAHNARFDRKVLYSCCDMAKAMPPRAPFLCTVSLARKAWGIRPTDLKNVCRHLRIPLQHHKASSDASACAKIVISALKQRKEIPKFMGPYHYFAM